MCLYHCFSFRSFVQCVVLLSAVLFLSPIASAVDKAVPKSSIEHSIISINKANAETLAAGLNGIGMTKARAIVAWRKQNGDFKRIDQLLEVKGIGEKTLAKNRSKISL